MGEVLSDKKGKLLLYHGTDAEFDKFSYEYMGQGENAFGPGFYFTNDIKEASIYGKNIYRAIVNFRNPINEDIELDEDIIYELIVAAHNTNDGMLEVPMRISDMYALGEYFEENPDNYWDSFLSNWASDFDEAVAQLTDSILNIYNNGEIISAFFTIWADIFQHDNYKYIMSMLYVVGVDGVVLERTHMPEKPLLAIAFNPNQVIKFEKVDLTEYGN